MVETKNETETTQEMETSSVLGKRMVAFVVSAAAVAAVAAGIWLGTSTSTHPITGSGSAGSAVYLSAQGAGSAESDVMDGDGSAMDANGSDATVDEGDAQAQADDTAETPSITTSSGKSETKGSQASISSSTSSSGDSTPNSHTHTWVPRTHQEPVYSQQWVVDQAAWDEPVYGYETTFICSDGAVYDNVDDACNHAGDIDGGYSVIDKQVQTGTKHHNEVGHWENVQTGTKTVTDGYVCSTCGATK